MRKGRTVYLGQVEVVRAVAFKDLYYSGGIVEADCSGEGSEVLGFVGVSEGCFGGLVVDEGAMEED